MTSVVSDPVEPPKEPRVVPRTRAAGDSERNPCANAADQGMTRLSVRPRIVQVLEIGSDGDPFGHAYGVVKFPNTFVGE